MNEIHRSELLETMNRDQSRLTIIVAPPGYGKSTLMRQHMEQAVASGAVAIFYRFPQDRTLTLGEFVRQIIPEDELALTQGREAADDYLFWVHRVVSYIEKLPYTLMIYLDDVHNRQDDQISQMIQYLVESGPPNLRLTSAGRRRPDLKTSHLKLSGEVVFIDRHALAFTEKQACSLLPFADGGNDVRSLLAKLEGWPAGIALTAMFSEETGDMEILLDTFEENKPLPQQMLEIFEYFSEQVMHELDQNIKSALMRLAILESFGEELAIKISAKQDIANVLNKLSDTGTFVEIVEGKTKFYRFHPIFRDFLLVGLGKSSPHLLPKLFELAARWFAERLDFGNALRFAAKTGDLSLINECAQVAEFQTWVESRGTTVWSAIDSFDDEALRPFASLLLGRAHLCVHRGEVSRARKLIDWSESFLDTIRNEVHRNRTKSFWRTLHLFTSLVEPWPAIESALPLYFETGSGEQEKRNLIETNVLETELLSWGLIEVGDFRRGAAFGARSAREANRRGMHMVEVYAHLAFAMNAIELGRKDEVAERMDYAKKLATKTMGLDSVQTIAASLLRASTLLNNGQPVKALASVLDRLPQLFAGEIWPPVSRELIRLTAWGTYYRDGYIVAESALREIAVQLEDRPMRPWHEVVQVHRLRIGIISGRKEAARQAIETSHLLSTLEERPDSRVSDWKHTMSARLALGMWRCMEHDLPRTEALLGHVDEDIISSGASTYRVEYHILTALVAHRRGKIDAFSQSLFKAAQAAEQTGNFLPFVQYSKILNRLWNDVEFHNHDGNGFSIILPHIRLIIAEASHGEPDSTGRKVIYPSELSPREGTVFLLLVDGYTGKEIANEMEISLNTVLGYRKSIYKKLHVSSRSKLVLIYRKLIEGLEVER